MDQKDEKLSKDEIDERNTKEALELAKNIFSIVTNKKFVKAYDADMRHKTVVQKYPNFANAYPVILRFIARDLKYNENAFKKFLNKLKVDPGKGMEGFIMRQADYAKYLYIEDCKMYGRHWSIKKAGQIWNIEYNHMRKSIKKLENEEKSAKNEFEEEQKKHLEIKKKELLDFVNMEDKNNTFEYNEEFNNEKEMEKYERAALGLHPKSLGDVEIEKLDQNQLLQFIRQLKDYKLSLHEEIEEKNNKIIELQNNMKMNITSQLKEEFPDNQIIVETDKENLIIYINNLKKTIIEIEKYVSEINKKLDKINIDYQNYQNKLQELSVDKSEWLEGLIGGKNSKSVKKTRPIKKVIISKKQTNKNEKKQNEDNNKEIDKLTKWIERGTYKKIS